MAMAVAMLAATSCSDADQPEAGQVLNVKGNVSGVWSRGSIVNVEGDIVVPEGQSLTIEEGVKVNVAGAVKVDGNLYCKGTEQNPIEINQPAAEPYCPAPAAGGTHRQSWQGIKASATCGELLIEHAMIGGAGVEGAVVSYANADGRCVVEGSEIYGGNGGALAVNCSEAVVSGNKFIDNGGNAVTLSAAKADVDHNMIYGTAARPVRIAGGMARVYNNTLANAGWLAQSAAVSAADGVRLGAFNNLLVNCSGRIEAGAGSEVDYNFYYSSQSDVDPGFMPAPVADGARRFDVHSVVAVGDDKGGDPDFVNYPFASVAVGSSYYNPLWDMHLSPSSAALSGAYVGPDAALAPVLAGGVNMGGSVFASKASNAWFGAYGPERQPRCKLAAITAFSIL